ncbi:MAG: hypothetical protein JXB10_12955 [Pirellulales bacterium]|nr:hypothetical protein [Pirellulales bacterium]
MWKTTLPLIGLLCLVGNAFSETAIPREGDLPTRALGLLKPGEVVPLREGFRDPPPISRVHCSWQIHGGACTEEEITRELEEFKDKGLGGVWIKDTWNMPRDAQTEHIKDIPFLSPEWLDKYAFIEAECRRLGLICRSWLGSGWNAGGPWVPPELSSQVLRFEKSTAFEGPTPFFSVRIPERRGVGGDADTLEKFRDGDAFVLAVRASDGKVVDLSDKVDGNLHVTWKVPEGKWHLYTFFHEPSYKRTMSSSRAGEGLHHDHLSEAGTDLQLKNVAERFLKKLGPFEKTAFDGFHCDSWELGNPTWTPGFRKAFEKRCGYDLVPYLPFLAGERSIPNGKRFFYDFRNTLSDLIVETHYRRVNDWCVRHGVAFDAEASAGPSHLIPNDLLKAGGAVGIPMGELWIHGRDYVKIPSSAAHAYGHRLTAVEFITQPIYSFAPSPFLMKKRGDATFLLGGNLLSLSCVNYSPKEAGAPGWVHSVTPRIDITQTWWPLARPFFDYLGRCSFLLQSGQNVAQVAVYRNFLEDKHLLWQAPREDGLDGFSKAFAFDYVNDDLIQNQMEVRDGRIVLPSGASYNVLYVYPLRSPFMPLKTLEKIRDLVRAGAKVVWAGKPPEQAAGLIGYPESDAAFKKIARELMVDDRVVKIPKHNYAALVPILERGPNPPAWRTEKGVPLRFVHRRTPDADVFFVVNVGDKEVHTPVTFRINDRAPELWDPATGAMQAVESKRVPDSQSVTLRLPSWHTVFVVFPRKSLGTPSPAAARGGPTPKPIAMNGPWVLEFPKGWKTPDQVTLEKLISWTKMDDDEIRHFNGIATYRTTFTCPEAVKTEGLTATLDLGRVAEIGEVYLNGKRVGVSWMPPFRLDVSGRLLPGENRLEVRVTAPWHNRLVADVKLPRAQRVSRMLPEERYRRYRNRKLIDSGLLGPVRIVFGPNGQ